MHYLYPLSILLIPNHFVTIITNSRLLHMHYLHPPSILLNPDHFITIISNSRRLHMHYLHPPSILLILDHFITIILQLAGNSLMPSSYALPSSSIYPVDARTFHNNYTATLAADMVSW